MATVVTRKPWTEEEEACLRRNYARRGAPWVAKRLKRTKSAVRQRALKLGLAGSRPADWTEQDLAYLRANIRLRSHAEIAAKLGRGIDAVNTRACKLGLDSGKRRPWTHREIAALKQLYGTLPNAELARHHLPGRDPEAIREKARRLGISSSHFKATDEALAELRRLVEKGRNDEEIAVLLGTNDVTARKYRRQMGLPHNGRSDQWREKIRRKTREQLREAGCSSLAELRWMTRRVEDARNAGPAPVGANP